MNPFIVSKKIILINNLIIENNPNKLFKYSVLFILFSIFVLLFSNISIDSLFIAVPKLCYCQVCLSFKKLIVHLTILETVAFKRYKKPIRNLKYLPPSISL